jgi:hypothetical protein
MRIRGDFSRPKVVLEQNVGETLPQAMATANSRCTCVGYQRFSQRDSEDAALLRCYVIDW